MIKSISLALVIASVLPTSAFAASAVATAYNCNEIESTTQGSYAGSRNLGREEIAKPQSRGGAYSPPRQASDVSCSPTIALAFSYFTTYSETFTNRSTANQAKNLLNLWANKACSALTSERNRINGIIVTPIN